MRAEVAATADIKRHVEYPRDGVNLNLAEGRATAGMRIFKSDVLKLFKHLAKMNPQSAPKQALAADMFIAIQASSSLSSVRPTTRFFHMSDAVDQSGRKPPDQMCTLFVTVSALKPDIIGTEIQASYHEFVEPVPAFDNNRFIKERQGLPKCFSADEAACDIAAKFTSIKVT